MIGDFSWITSVATAIDRVYVSSTSAVLIWNPQFRQWQGPYDPPDPAILARVFGSLVDPLDNSALARPARWLDPLPARAPAVGSRAGTGRCPHDRVRRQRSHARPLPPNAPAAGSCLPRGGLAPTPGRAPAARSPPARVDDVLRSTPTLQANAAQILVDPRLRVARFTAAARCVRQPGLVPRHLGCRGSCSCRTAPAFPERLPFGLRSPVVGAVFNALDGVWAATNRTTQAEPALTFVERELKDVPLVSGSARLRPPLHPVRKLVGPGHGALGGHRSWARPHRAPATVAYDLLDQSRGPPGRPGVCRRVAAGTDHRGHPRGVVRVNDSLHVERAGPAIRGRRSTRSSPSGDSVWVGTQRGLLVALPGGAGRGPALHARHRVSPGARASRSARSAIPSSPSPATSCSGAIRAPRPGRSVPTCAPLLGGLRGVRGRTGQASGSRANGASPSRGWHASPLRAAPGRATSRATANDVTVDATSSGSRPTAVSSASGSTPSARERPSSSASARVRPRARIAAALGARPGLGDDCAVLAAGDGSLVASTDASVEDVHFRLDWLVARGDRLACRGRRAVRPRGRRRRRRWVCSRRVAVPEAAEREDVVALMLGVGAPRAKSARDGGRRRSLGRAGRGASPSP